MIIHIQVLSHRAFQIFISKLVSCEGLSLKKVRIVYYYDHFPHILHFFLLLKLNLLRGLIGLSLKNIYV